MALSDGEERLTGEDALIAGHLGLDGAGLSAEHHRKYCSPMWLLARERYDREMRDSKPIPPLRPPDANSELAAMMGRLLGTGPVSPEEFERRLRRLKGWRLND
jgi:hypothetical protein